MANGNIEPSQLFPGIGAYRFFCASQSVLVVSIYEWHTFAYTCAINGCVPFPMAYAFGKLESLEKNIAKNENEKILLECARPAQTAMESKKINERKR